MADMMDYLLLMEAENAGGGGGGGDDTVAPLLRDITINNTRTAGQAATNRVYIYGIYNDASGRMAKVSLAGGASATVKLVVSGPEPPKTVAQYGSLLLVHSTSISHPIVIKDTSTAIYRQAAVTFSEAPNHTFLLLWYEDGTDPITLDIGE